MGHDRNREKEMIKCPMCKRITEKGEPTGTFRLMENLEKGKRIVSSQRVCINCMGEKSK